MDHREDPGPRRDHGGRGSRRPYQRRANPRQGPKAQNHGEARYHLQVDGNQQHDVWRRNRSPSREQRDGRSRPHHSDSRGNPHGNDSEYPRKKVPRKQFMGFRRLEEISNTDPKETLAKILESKTAFLELIDSPIQGYDMFVVLMKIIAKICQSSFDEIKARMLIDICNSKFLNGFKNYLTDLPYPKSKMSNNMYWKDPELFWRDVIVFYECIVTTSPTLAIRNRSLLEAVSMGCLSILKERHSFELPEELNHKLMELKERLTDYERKNEEKKTSGSHMHSLGAPPETFRELSIMPTRDDLIHHKPYVRPNIVDGHYQDVEHYLDVQFRLLREDCFGPLRKGLNQFLEDQTRKRFDNIRVFRNVKFVMPYVSQTKVGSMVQIDVATNKMFKRIKWANNKRFIYGSLVLFTKDNCKSLISAIILDREEHYLAQGLVPVNIIDQPVNLNLYNDDVYTMIESEVYFEPYYHVLKVLQDPKFPQHLAMKQYIVDVLPNPRHPSYLDENTEFTIETQAPKPGSIRDLDDMMDFMDIEEHKKSSFVVLQDSSWPKKEDMSFNDSQYDAFKLSLCHEFAVVQGPPGTGKTYLGIKVAKALFENLKDQLGCLMLVICYKNHALDQFLGALLDITHSIVRIGGQSKNDAMKDISINKLRSNSNNKAFFEAKMDLKQTIENFQRSLVDLDVLLNGVMKANVLQNEDPVILPLKYLCDYYKNINADPLFYWLFEHYGQFYEDDVNDLLEETNIDDSHAKLEKENRKRTGFSIDDQDTTDAASQKHREIISSFSLEIVYKKIKELVTEHKALADVGRKYQIEQTLQELKAHKRYFNEMSVYRRRRPNVTVHLKTNFSQIAPIERWSLYFGWIQDRLRMARHEAAKMQEEVNKASARFEEARMMQDMHVLHDTKIVGMTTSGAARMHKLLRNLNPPIVIVEEAAEVLEQHIITSLTEGCKHLILIGDHQQLRPSASHMKLAKHFNIEVSLFERMINNGIQSRRLSVQHRMRPEIAALICPHIYPELINHPSVYDFPDVMGMTKNLYFYSHDFKEEEIDDSNCRTNKKEADMTLALAHYLMQQGYQPEDVTVLAAYKGQMFYMRKNSVNYPHLDGVNINVVDNYQGEESKIILLSLVRNNDDNNIGFLGTPNRICVALSRAKHGFYILGNIETLKKSSELWRNIAGTLETGDYIGNTLTLMCQNHPENMTIIEKVEDFWNTPEGGCLQACKKSLPKCGHMCPLQCHGYDREHATNATKCTRKCERIQCLLNHVCPKKCFEDCGPCMRKVLKKLPCGHESQIYCHLEPEDPRVKCHTKVTVTLPDCKHEAQKPCHMDIKLVRCEVNCEFRVEKCGHSCLKKCHVKDDPDHKKYLCMKMCSRAKRDCKNNLDGDRGDHQCQLKCYEPCAPCDVQVVKRRTTCKHMIRTQCNVAAETIPCLKKCSRALPCGHFCKKKCQEPCGDCRELVTKKIPDCNHEIKLECEIEPIKQLCAAKCEREMSCGHKCKGLCKNDCLPEECIEPSPKKLIALCGHLVALPCKYANLPAESITAEMLLDACTARCDTDLQCKHVCQGSCASCRRGRLHQPCRQPCNQDNVCSHKCTDPCNQTCPPCHKSCSIRCKHNKCNKKCGEPCTPCKEPCGRRCVHGACKNRCSEPCTRPPCNEPCPKELTCKHPCRGLCGEPCPPVCKECMRDDFPVDFFGDSYEDSDKLIVLQDCGHIMEVETMDNLMMSKRDGVKITCCPFIEPIVCRKPIINTGRYKDLINAIFKNEINPIKKKVFGTQKIIIETDSKLRMDIGTFQAKYTNVLKDNKDLRMILLKLQSIVNLQKKTSKLQLDMELVCLDIIDMVSECYNDYLKANATVLKQELSVQVGLICSIVDIKVKNTTLTKISMQQRNDAKLEIRRLNAIVQLAKLLSHQAYTSSKHLPKVSEALDTAKASLFSHFIFKEDETIDALKKLQNEIKVSGVVTKQERDLVVRAIGLKSGHWFKCPNGHFYCIGECGGAMKEGNCVDCGARIGGGSHALRADNRHAPEVDGSSFPAWSEQYNNMANFDLNMF